MLYTKIQPQSLFIPYMDMTAILFICAEPFEQINKLAIPFRQKFMKNLVKIALAVSEKKTFKNYTILYRYIAL